MSYAGHEGYEAIAALYDHVELYRTRPDIEFYVEAARESGGPVLEVACGTGRVLIPTARAGIEIMGLDGSAEMLAVCRAQLQSEPEDVQSRVQLIQSDMREFELSRKFPLITMPFRPFQHLTTVDAQLACLETIRGHLADGGRFIFDMFNPWLEMLVTSPLGEELAPEPEFSTPDGRRVVRSHKILAQDRFTQVNRYEMIYDITHPDGRKERQIQPFSLRYTFRFEAEHLLARAGFTVEHLYGGLDKSAYGSTYPGELIFVARKR
jgi:SAM-dependent methyltransferase